MRTLIGGLGLSLWLCVPGAFGHLPGASDDDHVHSAGDLLSTKQVDAAGNRSGYARKRIAAFRVSGDDRELARAWRYLEQDLQQAAPPFETLISAAYVVQGQHDFAAAMRYLDRAQALRPLTDEAWLLKASLHLLRGESAQALDACRALSLNNIYARMFCAGRVASVAPEGARHAYDRLMLLAERLDAQPGLLAWARSVLGDLAAAMGDTDAAVWHYKQALTGTEQSQVRAALVDQLIDARRWQEAWRYLDLPTRSLAIHIRRYIVAPHVGQLAAVAADIEQTDRSFRRWIARGDWLHAREMSRFYVDVLPKPYLANRLARVNYMQQKEPEDRRLVRRTL